MLQNEQTNSEMAKAARSGQKQPMQTTQSGKLQQRGNTANQASSKCSLENIYTAVID